MVEAILDKEITEKVRQSDAIDALEEKFREGVRLAKRIGRTSTDAAEDLLDDTTRQIKRHPAGSVMGALLAGVVIGGILGFFIRKK